MEGRCGAYRGCHILRTVLYWITLTYLALANEVLKNEAVLRTHHVGVATNCPPASAPGDTKKFLNNVALADITIGQTKQ
jgi:hypothetical protein